MQLSSQICFIIVAHVHICNPIPWRNDGICHEHTVVSRFGLTQLINEFGAKMKFLNTEDPNNFFLNFLVIS